MELNNDKKMNVYTLKNNLPVILLNYDVNQSLVWIGTNKENNHNNEKPLILKFNDKNVYFYSQEIKELDNSKLNEYLIDDNTNIQYQLTSIQQKELINSFANTIDQNNLTQKLILLELQNEYLKKENEELKWENVELNLKNSELTWENGDLKLKNDFNDAYNKIKTESNDLNVNEKNTLRKEIKTLNKKVNDLESSNNLHKHHIDELTKVKDNLCQTIGISFEVHEIITTKTEELFSIKGRPKTQLKSFIKKITFLTQTLLNKFSEETKDLRQTEADLDKNNEHLNEQNQYYWTIKQYYDQQIDNAMDQWKHLNKKPKDITKKEVFKKEFKKEKELAIINEESEFEHS